MHMGDLYALPTGAVIQLDHPSDDDLRALHRLGFHPQRMNSQAQTLIKQLAPGYALRGLDENESAFQDACRELLADERETRCRRLQ
jgi:hypothetical protein